MSSKILGAESEFFANLAVTAALRVKLDRDGKSKCPISNIHILKSHGKSGLDSVLVDGFALNCTRASAAMPTRLPTPEGRAEGQVVKVALLDFNLQKHKLQMGVQVVVTDTKQVEEIRQREMDITREKIHAILNTGAKVVLTTKGIDDLCMKYFVEAGAIAVRRVTKEDMKRIAKATGGQVVVTMSDMEGNEVFDPACLGECEEVAERAVGDSHLLYFSGPKVGSACTIVLRGANEFMLDEMDRALHDSLCVIKRIIESNSLVAGGGAVEAAVSVFLEETARTMGTKEQLAVACFAEALLVIPRTLTVNAAHDATELVARLRASHHKSQAPGASDEDRKLRFSGLDLYKGEIRNNLEAGVVEPAISKIKSLRFATEAAIAILRIDDMIKLNVHKERR
jgi:T-complex protein 1 subunit alpha